MSEKALVTDLQVRTSGAVGPLREYETVAKSTDAALAAMADSVATGVETMSSKAGAALGRLADGGKVSTSAFDAMAVAADNLRNDVIARFGSMENAPEPFRAAIAHAEQTVRDLSAEIGRSADRTAALREEFSETTEVVEDLEVVVDATADALEALNEEQERAAELAREVGEEYGDTADRIVEIRTASDKTFPQQRKDLEAIQKELKEQESEYKKMGSVGEEALKKVRVESGRVEAAIEQLSKEAQTGTSKIRDGVIVAEKAFAKFTETLTENPKEAVEEIAKVAGAVVQLRNAIKTTQDAGGPVDPAALAKLQAFERNLESAKLEAGALKREIDKTTAGVNNAAQQWQGFDSVLTGAVGKFGEVGVAAIGAAAALKEGWSIGMQLNQVFGTDMSEWDKSLARFGAKAKAIFAAISDYVLSTSHLLVAVMTGDIEGVKKAWADFKDTSLAGTKVMSEALTTYGADWDKLHPKIKAVTKATEDGAAAKKKAAEEAKRLQDAARELAEEKTRLATEIASVSRSIAEETEEMKKQLGLADTAKSDLVNRASDMGYYGRRVEEATAAVSAQSTEVSDLTAKYGAQSPLVKAATERLDELQHTLGTSKTRYEEAGEEVRKYEAQQKAAAAAAERAADNVEKLGEKVAESTTKLNATSKAAEATAFQINAVSGSASSTAPTISKAFAQWLDDAVRIELMSKSVDELNGRLRILETVSREAAVAVRELGKATVEATGTEDDFKATGGGQYIGVSEGT